VKLKLQIIQLFGTMCLSKGLFQGRGGGGRIGGVRVESDVFPKMVGDLERIEAVLLHLIHVLAKQLRRIVAQIDFALREEMRSQKEKRREERKRKAKTGRKEEKERRESESNQSNQSNQIESNRIKSNQSNQSNQIESNRFTINPTQLRQTFSATCSMGS
jgi:hypothetical protein